MDPASDDPDEKPTLGLEDPALDEPETATKTWRRPSERLRAVEPGWTIDRYTVREELGRGGMGVVYRAWDPELKRHVALKLVPADASDDRRERFLDEALASARLQHPSLVPIFGKGRTPDGELYYTMREVRGLTLDGIVQGKHNHGPEVWTRFKLLQVFVTVCHAVAYAHDQGVIHRDLKPSNVMVDRFGGVYVLDWGLAKAISRRLDPGGEGTLASGITGTPAFMAPEQATGGYVGPSADIYGLGGILYVLLTGALPRQGTRSQAYMKILRKVMPPPPSTLEPQVPQAIDRICLQALAPEQEDRPESAAALADSVQAFLEARPLNPRGRDADFLRSYSAADYRRPSVTVDIILLARSANGPTAVFLRHRRHPPFAGAWACPGSFMRMEESLEETAERVLVGDAELPSMPAITQMRTYGAPGRDPRTRVITIAFLAVVHERMQTADPEYGGWFEINDPSVPTITHSSGDAVELAFDHATLIRDGLSRLQ